MLAGFPQDMPLLLQWQQKNVTTHAEDLQIARVEKNKQTRRKQKRAKEKAQSETGHTVENYPWVKMQ